MSRLRPLVLENIILVDDLSLLSILLPKDKLSSSCIIDVNFFWWVDVDGFGGGTICNG